MFLVGYVGLRGVTVIWIFLRLGLTFEGGRYNGLYVELAFYEVHKTTGAELVFNGIVGLNLGTAPFVSFPNSAA